MRSHDPNRLSNEPGPRVLEWPHQNQWVRNLSGVENYSGPSGKTEISLSWPVRPKTPPSCITIRATRKIPTTTCGLSRFRSLKKQKATPKSDLSVRFVWLPDLDSNQGPAYPQHQVKYDAKTPHKNSTSMTHQFYTRANTYWTILCIAHLCIWCIVGHGIER